MTHLGHNNTASLPGSIRRCAARPVTDHFLALEALPAEARRIMCEASPIDFDAVDILQQWQRIAMTGMPRAEMLRALAASVRETCRQTAAHDYGPDHPQARTA